VTGYFIKQDDTSNLYLPDNANIENPIKILFFGDMMLDRSVADIIKKNGLDYVFGKLDEVKFYNDYDLIMANLESAVTNEGNYYPPINKFDFAISPEVLAGTKDYNFNFFNLANNHFDDQGVRGMNETRENLDKLGFDYVGCKNGIIDDCSSKIIELKNNKIGMVGLSVLGNTFEREKIIQIISQLKDKTDLVVVNIHWGDEYIKQFNNTQQKIAYILIDSGADLIIGHHPHVVQGIEVYKNKPIFYSLGNFVFDQYFSEETQRGLAIEFILKEDELNFKLHPLKSQKSQITLMTGTEKNIFLQEVIKQSMIDEIFVKQIGEGTLSLNN